MKENIKRKRSMLNEHQIKIMSMAPGIYDGVYINSENISFLDSSSNKLFIIKTKNNKRIIYKKFLEKIENDSIKKVIEHIKTKYENMGIKCIYNMLDKFLIIAESDFMVDIINGKNNEEEWIIETERYIKEMIK